MADENERKVGLLQRALSSSLRDFTHVNWGNASASNRELTVQVVYELAPRLGDDSPKSRGLEWRDPHPKPMEDLAVRAYSMKFFDAAIKYKGEEGAYAFFKEDISIWLLSLKSW